MKKIITQLSYIAFFLLACSNKDDKVEESIYLKIPSEVQTLQYTEKAQTANITIETNSNDWTVQSNDNWCDVKRISSNSQVFRISVETNEETEIRETTLSLKASGIVTTIKVQQLGTAPAILLNPTSLENLPSTQSDIEISVTTNVEAYTFVIPEDAQNWVEIVETPPTRAMIEYKHLLRIKNNMSLEARSTTLSVEANSNDKEPKATLIINQKKRSTNADDVVVEGDIQIKPTSGKDNQHHAGNDITKTFDGKKGADSEPFHSPWAYPYDDPTTIFPVTLEYDFAGDNTIDYIVYYPRGGNGDFGKFKLYTANADNDSYVLEGEYDFGESNITRRLLLKNPLQKATKIKFEITSGAGGFASCDEMEFYQLNEDQSIDRLILNVFTDLTCSNLKENVTEEQINALPGILANIAVQLKNGTYDEWEKNFRIRDYEAYSDIGVWADKLMTKKYSNLDNPTGIYVKEGESIIVLVGDTYGHEISLQCISEEKSGDYVQTAANGESYFLKSGVNKINIQKAGMLFVMYTADPSEAPVRVHIPTGCGTVNGFFDLKEHKTDIKYAELLQKATYKYFCVRGEKIIFYFHTSKMREYVPNNILSAINLWDDIISWQQELMGIDDVRPSQVNNHLFAISPEGSYMWASDYRIGFVYTYLNNILLYDNVMAVKDNAWGPAHEIGHIHQAAINWPSSTESSNNLFSNFVIYKLGKYGSRGDVLSSLATARFVNNQGWYNMGTSTHQKEDTEIHMRMNWQLWNYYHRCGYNSQFWPTLFKLLRENRIIESDPGSAQLKFAKMACKAANEDLTEFFDMWGFFEPVNNVTIEQYGEFKYNVTASMIKEAKEYMATFKKKAEPFYYLEDRRQTDFDIDNYQVGDVGHYEQFKNKAKITKTITATISGQQVSIANGDEAVAFEIRKNDQLIYFSNFLNFNVPSSISLTNATIYAVQANGERIEIKNN